MVLSNSRQFKKQLVVSTAVKHYMISGADPGFRRGGGGSYIQKGGGFVQEFQERIQIVAGPWANQQAKKKLQTAVGGGPITPPPQKKKPVSAPG